MHLTFDDGPDPRGTPAVLDALAAAGATATFFVLGECAAAQPALIERILAGGHAVEVHGHGHLRHPLTSRECVEGDLDAALTVLRGYGIAPRLWRVPWGDLASWTAEVAAERGLTLAGWTADTHDWRGDDAATMLAALEPELRAGAIVLAHDGIGPGARRSGAEETARLIDPLVSAARARGLEPQPLDPATPPPAGNPDLALDQAA
jgi:peptidoglycan/xylan/chitin deacetylase (PgdA/CDA1 family)